MSLPVDVTARFTALMNRMGARGVTQTVTVYAYATVTNASGQPAAKERAVVGTLQALVVIGGGSQQLGQEGARVQQNDQIGFIPTALLSPENYAQVWVSLPGQNAVMRRVISCQTFGPYTWCQLEAGSTSDKAGNMR